MGDGGWGMGDGGMGDGGCAPHHVTQDHQRDDTACGAAHVTDVSHLFARNELEQAAEHEQLGQVDAHDAHGLRVTRYAKQ